MINRSTNTMAAQPQDPNADLGFGSVVTRESRARLLNRDGSFNVKRRGLPFWQSRSAYHVLLTMSWPRFLALVMAGYLLTNALFAIAYMATGTSGLSGDAATRFSSSFFFSVHTLGTIGYGNVSPENFAANVLVTIEAFVGLLGVALVAGIMFARFARPVADIVFSKFAVVGPYRDATAFMFRIANRKSNELVELQAKLLLTRRREAKDPGRSFVQLRLERDRVSFFPLTWTIVHPIDESSPLYGVDADELRRSDAEFLILLTGFDETFSQNVHARSSYKWGEIVFDARFKNLFEPPDENGVLSVNIREIDEIEKLGPRPVGTTPLTPHT